MTKEKGTLRCGIMLHDWALPLYVRWSDDVTVWYVAVHILCFAVSYERWRV